MVILYVSPIDHIILVVIYTYVNFIGKRTIVHLNNMFENAHYIKPIFQELISRVLLEIETRDQVFCIALEPVTICIAIRTIGLLYLFYNTG